MLATAMNPRLCRASYNVMATTDFSFAFRADEKTGVGFFRILGEISERAQALVKGEKAGEEPVHGARLLIKRTRAMLWFARPVMTEAVYEQGKTQLRKAAKFLSGQRDLRVAKSTLEKIGKKAAPDDRPAVQEAIQHLEGKSAPLTKEKESLNKAMRALVRLIAALKVPRNARWPKVSQRIDKAHRSERKAARKAEKTQADLDMHAWRKKAKRLFYELELAKGNGASPKRRVLKDADELQDRLGKHHDCVVVEQHLQTPTPTAAAARVVEILRTEKKNLRKKSRKVARRLKSEL